MISSVDFDGTRDIVPKSIENTGRFPAPAQKDIPFNTGLFSVSQIYDNGYPVQYGNVLNIGGAGVSQIAVGWTGGIFHRGASDISNQWSNWREIAYIDSNVASATKLKNSRNLWGNNFDGTADTNGTLNFGDAGARKILIKAETVTDGGYIAVGNQGQDRGYIEIGTTDDENTEIWAAQRRGENGEFVRLARLLDESGNTSFPGNTSAYSFQLTTAPGDINKIAPGNGDGASYDNHNLVIRSWWGIGFRDYQDKCRIFIDTRTGNLKTKGTVEAGYITTEGNVNAGNAVTAKNVVASSDVKAEGWMYATKYVGKDGSDSEFVGNASSATKLKTARKICGFDFDGSGDINIFPNNRLLPIGDDVFMGDGDVSGCLVIQSNSNTTPGIQFRNNQGQEVGRIQGGNISGNAATASKLQNSRNISISGAVSGNAWFDGSGDININTTLNQGLGVGQSWQDVTSNRAENTTYTNTTSKPIQIIVTSNDWNSSGALEFIVDNVSIANTSNSSAYSQSKSTSVIVPSGSSYRVNGNFKKWSELR
ncbi:tail fiber protein [Acinetobacter sp. 243_ASPC]|uniref:tail fiber protein n=1 Tax=Acinetobacter sp. 243_ASPC TaxID=1579345 RepID=UPI0009D73927|nr:tail fiber protein [Acinetobacter sp. 243_ASPC]